MLAALTLSSLSLLVWASKICPPTCQCLHNLKTIGCQEKGLDQIPELPDGTVELYVSYNEIQEIPRRGLEKLQVWNIQQPVNCTLCMMPLEMMQYCGQLVRDSSNMKVPGYIFHVLKLWNSPKTKMTIIEFHYQLFKVCFSKLHFQPVG